MKPKKDSFRWRCHGLNETQIKILYRVLSEKVIGKNLIGYTDRQGRKREAENAEQEIENLLKDAQRKRLKDYLEIKEEV